MLFVFENGNQFFFNWLPLWRIQEPSGYQEKKNKFYALHCGQLIIVISSHCSDESLRNYIDHPSSEQLRACSDILSNALNVRLHLSQQESFMGLSSQAILTFLWIPLFFQKTHALSSLFSNCQVKKLVFFYQLQFGQISLNFSLHILF